MGVNTDVHQVLAAVSVLKRAREACVNLKPMGCPMTEVELRQRAAVVDKVIRARAKLQRIKDRADSLKNDLDRFKARREAMRA